MFKKLNSWMQIIGRSMLLAIAVMPAAAILNRIGDKDLLNLVFIKEAAWSIFNFMPAIFAISVAGGIAKDKHVAAGLNGYIVYAILIRILRDLGSGFNSFSKPAIIYVEYNLLIGIIAGIVAGIIYEKFKETLLPSGLAFFSGRRLVLIMGSFAAIITGAVLSYVFPYIQKGIDFVGHSVGQMNYVGPFIFGFLNRILIPTGLHHILNTYIQMQLPSPDISWAAKFPNIVGEIPRYFAGDPTAGTFVAGFFPMFMFGLPAAALAMLRTSKTKNLSKAKGILVGAAFTVFLTGISEPVEFSFMFISPLLFLVHAIFTGVANVLANIFNAKMVGVGGSGIIDFILQYKQSTNPWLLVLVGVIIFILYYFTFKFLIEKFDLKTPGREEEIVDVMTKTISERAHNILKYVGGIENILELDNCITRLRLKLASTDIIDEEKLKEEGSIGIIRQSDNRIQIIIGLEVEQIANEMKKIK